MDSDAIMTRVSVVSHVRERLPLTHLRGSDSGARPGFPSTAHLSSTKDKMKKEKNFPPFDEATPRDVTEDATNGAERRSDGYLDVCVRAVSKPRENE